LLFTAIEKRISLKVKKEIVAFHLNNNPFINSLAKSVNNWNDLPVLTKKNLQPLTERLSTGYSKKCPRQQNIGI
jgi:hypothetical protein